MKIININLPEIYFTEVGNLWQAAFREIANANQAVCGIGKTIDEALDALIFNSSQAMLDHSNLVLMHISRSTD